MRDNRAANCQDTDLQESARSEAERCAISGCRVVPVRHLPETALCQAHFEQLRLEFMPAVFTRYPPHTWLRASREYEEAFGRPRMPRWVTTQPAASESLQRYGDDHAPVVYFIVWGDRCKIGTTVNIPKRVATLSLPSSAVRLTRPGSYQEERKWHGRFAACRIAGTEWFRVEGHLADFLAAA